MLESLGVVIARLTLDLTPAHGRPRRATVTVAIVGAGAWTPGPAAAVTAVAVVALATVWHPIPGVRSSAVAILVIATAAVIFAPPTVHIVRRSRPRVATAVVCSSYTLQQAGVK